MLDKATVLTELARTMARHDAGLPLAHRLGSSAGQLMGAAGTAITIAYTTVDRVTICATDDLAARMEDLQDVLGQGPGHVAYTTGQQVPAVFGDVASDDRWPLLAKAAREMFGSVRFDAIPIRPGRAVLGVLTCHQPPPGGLVLGASTTQFLADAVGAALLDDPQKDVVERSSPWSSRASIHQATGMVVAQLGVTTDDAVALLRAHAFAHEHSLADTATAVVSRELDFSREDAEGEGPS